MQERAKIVFSNIAIQGIETNAAEKESIVLNELLANKSIIEDLLISYYFKSRGRVYNVKIGRPEMRDEKHGSFKVNYNIGHFNACADVDSSEEESMQIQFEIDYQTNVAMLTGEYFPEREPDEF